MNIPDEAVDAVARSLYHTSGRYRVMTYTAAKADCEAEASDILEAAAPLILRQAALELMRVDEAPSRMPGIRFAVGFLGGITKPKDSVIVRLAHIEGTIPFAYVEPKDEK